MSKETQLPTLIDLQYLVQGIDPQRAPPGLFQRMFGGRGEQEGGQGAAAALWGDAPRLRRGPAGVFAEPGPGDFTYSGAAQCVHAGLFVWFQWILHSEDEAIPLTSSLTRQQRYGNSEPSFVANTKQGTPTLKDSFLRKLLQAWGIGYRGLTSSFTS